MSTYYKNVRFERRGASGTGSFYTYGIAGDIPHLQFDFKASYLNLPTSLVLEGATVAPSILLRASEIDLSGSDVWPGAAGTITFNSSGTGAVSYHGPFPDGHSSGTNRWYATNPVATDPGKIGTEDFVFEFILAKPAGVSTDTENPACYNASLPSANMCGWRFRINAGGGIEFAMTDEAEVAESVCKGTDADWQTGAWIHCMVFCDRSSATGLAMYVNGQRGGTVGNPTGNAGNLYYAPNGSDTTDVGNGGAAWGIAHFGMWKQASWLNGSTYDSFVANRFRTVCGYNHSKVSSVTQTHTETRRAGDAYDSTAGTRKVFYVGPRWIPVRNRQEGYEPKALSSAGYNNRIQVSNTDLTTWTYVNAGEINIISATAPDGLSYNCGLAVTGAAVGSAGMSALATGAGGANACFSAFIKQGSSRYCVVALATRYCYFDFQKVGGAGFTTIDANYTNTTRVESWGDGWYRVFIWGTMPAGTTVAFYPSDTINAFSPVAGDGATVNTYFWNPQLLATHYDNDPPVIQSVNTSKSAEVLRITLNAADEIEDTQTFKFDTLHQPGTLVAAGGDEEMIKFTDGGAAADQVLIARTNDGKLHVTSAATAGTAGDVTTSGTFNSGAEIAVKVRNAASVGVEVFKNSVQDANEDTTVTPPNDIDRIDLYGNVMNLKVYKKVV